MGTQTLVNVMEQRHVGGIVETVRPRHEAVGEHLLGFRHAGLRQRDRLVFLIDDVVAGLFQLFAFLGLDVALSNRAFLEPRNNPIDFVIQVGGFLSRAGDDQRCSRFVDQDAVDFVDDRVVVAALHH